MGEVTIAGFGILGVIGIALLLFGIIRRGRLLIVAGAALLLALAGAWVLGIPGAAAGLVPLAFAKGGGGSAEGRGESGRDV